MNKWFALPHSTRFAIGVWIALLGGVLGRVAIDSTEAQTVLPIYLEGGLRWAHGEPLYAPMPEGLDVYRNPPVVAVLTVPFTRLPQRAAALIWRVLFISLYLLGLFQFLRDCAPPKADPTPQPPPRSGEGEFPISNPLRFGEGGSRSEPSGVLSPLRRSIFFMLSAVLVLSSFNNAQLNLLLVASALLGTAAAARGSWWASAFWLTLAAQVKIYPLALVGLVCVIFPRTMIWRSALLMILGLALPFAASDPQYALDQYRSFAEASKADDRSDAPMVRGPRDWTRLVRVFGPIPVPREITLPLSALAGIAFAVWVTLTRKENRLRLAFCLGLLWMVLFGPSTEMNTYSILAPVAAWLACRERSGLFAWLGAGMLLAAILRAAFPSDFTHGLGFMQPFAAIVLLVATARKSWYNRGSLPEPHQ
jgi:hypothetical protein